MSLLVSNASAEVVLTVAESADRKLKPEFQTRADSGLITCVPEIVASFAGG
jgi:hypothetical protein